MGVAVEAGLTIRTLFSPDDDVQGEFLQWLATTRDFFRGAIYGFHLPQAKQHLIALHQRGGDVALVIDHIEAHGQAEGPDVADLREAGVPLLEGTSTRDRIMHHKFAIQDHRSVWAGSWNWSLTAQLESNYVDIIDNPDRAALFLSKWQEIWDYMKAHDMKWNQ